MSIVSFMFKKNDYEIQHMLIYPEIVANYKMKRAKFNEQFICVFNVMIYFGSVRQTLIKKTNSKTHLFKCRKTKI